MVAVEIWAAVGVRGGLVWAGSVSKSCWLMRELLEPLSSRTGVSRPSVCRFCVFSVPRSVAVMMGSAWDIAVSVVYVVWFGGGGGWVSCVSLGPSVFPPLY